MLRPDQLPRYDKWQAERDAMHKRERRPPAARRRQEIDFPTEKQKGPDNSSGCPAP